MAEENIEYNSSFAAFNLCLFNLEDISFALVGQDTDGNFSDCSQEDIDSTHFLQLLPPSENVSSDTFEAVNNKISSLNVIKLIKDLGDENYQVLAYRPFGYTVPIVPSEDSQLKVIVSLFTDVSQEQQGSIQLDYLTHSKQLPQDVHSNIQNLSIENPAAVPTFALALENKSNGLTDFEGPTNGNVWRSVGTTAYYYGTGHTYSNMLWYYWQPSEIIPFLNYLAGQMPSIANYISLIIPKIQAQYPFLGFNARYGSYLYWYNITAEYICVIYAGSMHFNNVDVYIVKNNNQIQPQECEFFDESRHATRIKINRWYDHLYFIADGKAWQINVDVNGFCKYQKTVRNSFTYADNTQDYLVYNLRAFQTDTENAIKLDTLGETTATYYQLEFSDIGDVLVCEFKDANNQTRIGIHNILDTEYFKTYTIEDPINALELYSNTSKLFNIFTIDDQNIASRIKSLYQTSLVHLQYFIKNNIKPVFMSEALSIGWDSSYGVFLVLWKNPQGNNANTMTSRHRFPANWLTNILGISQGQLIYKDRSGFHFKNILNDEISHLGIIIAADRGVIIKEASSEYGCYRIIA